MAADSAADNDNDNGGGGGGSDDLFASALGEKDNSSGYGTVNDVHKSDTMEDVSKVTGVEEDDDDDLFKSARGLEPEPAKANPTPVAAPVGNLLGAGGGDVIDLDEDENPFQVTPGRKLQSKLNAPNLFLFPLERIPSSS